MKKIQIKSTLNEDQIYPIIDELRSVLGLSKDDTDLVQDVDGEDGDLTIVLKIDSPNKAIEPILKKLGTPLSGSKFFDAGDVVESANAVAHESDLKKIFVDAFIEDYSNDPEMINVFNTLTCKRLLILSRENNSGVSDDILDQLFTYIHKDSVLVIESDFEGKKVEYRKSLYGFYYVDYDGRIFVNYKDNDKLKKTLTEEFGELAWFTFFDESGSYTRFDEDLEVRAPKVAAEYNLIAKALGGKSFVELRYEPIKKPEVQFQFKSNEVFKLGNETYLFGKNGHMHVIYGLDGKMTKLNDYLRKIEKTKKRDKDLDVLFLENKRGNIFTVAVIDQAMDQLEEFTNIVKAHVVKGSIFEDLIQNNYPKAEIITYDNKNELLDTLGYKDNGRSIIKMHSNLRINYTSTNKTNIKSNIKINYYSAGSNDIIKTIKEEIATMSKGEDTKEYGIAIHKGYDGGRWEKFYSSAMAHRVFNWMKEGASTYSEVHCIKGGEAERLFKELKTKVIVHPSLEDMMFKMNLKLNQRGLMARPS